MSDELRDFFVQIGFKLDDSGLKKAERAQTTAQQRLTAKADEQGRLRLTREQFRQAQAAAGTTDLSKLRVETEKKTTGIVEKVQRDHAARLTRLDIDTQKKAKERRETAFKDLVKNSAQIESVLAKVAVAAGSVGSALVGSSLARDVLGTASSFSRLFVESTRTQSMPQHIKAAIYGLTQLGVDQGEAEGSLGNFSTYLQQNPGLKSILAKAGIDVNQSPAQIFAQLGRYFKTLRPNVALAAAGRMGIGQNAELGLQRGEYAQNYREGLTKFSAADAASKDGRELTQAYDRLATDLSVIKDRIEQQFFKPMAAGLNSISDLLEKNPEKAKAFGEGLVAFAGLMSLRVIPTVVKLATAMMGINTAFASAPAALLRALGLGSAAAGGLAGAALLGSTTSLNAGEPTVNPDGSLTSPDGTTRPGRVWDGLGAKIKDRAKRALGLGDGRDITAVDKTIPPEGRALLDTIAKGEAPDYNVMNGGGRFASYADHPGGRAAGRYQFLPSTWRGIQRQTGLKDFSPDSQDKGGWFLAQRDYRLRTGRNLLSDLQSGDPARLKAINGALAPTWVSLTNADRFSRLYGGNLARQRMGAPAAAARDRQMLPPGAMYWATDSEGNPVAVDAKGQSMALPSLSRPLGDSPSIYRSYDNSRTKGDTVFNQTNNIHGVTEPSSVAATLNVQARRGGQDIIRSLQGSTQ